MSGRATACCVSKGKGTGIDSDSYYFELTSAMRSPPPYGLIGYNFTYLDLRSGQWRHATTHNPTVVPVFA